MTLKESKRFAKGKYAIPKLFDEANKHHKEACAAWRGALENARKSGEALVKARSYFPMRSRKWRKWVEDNFDGAKSYETAKVYMRIARKWDDPRLVAARESGMKINSIVSVLRVLKYQRLKDEDTAKNLSPKEAIASMADAGRDILRKDFAEKLRNLSLVELEILTEGFELYFWPRLYTKLRDTVCAVLGYDPDEDLVIEKVDKRSLIRYGKEYKLTKSAKKTIDNIRKVSEFEQRLEEKKEARQKVQQVLNKDKRRKMKSPLT